MSSLHRLDIPAELFIKLVDKDRCATWLTPPARDPFVPAGYHDEGGSKLPCPRPLFLKIESLVHRAWRGILTALMKTASASISKAHISHFAIGSSEVLRDGDVDLLRSFRVLDVTVGLGIGRFPMPGQWRIRSEEHTSELQSHSDL